MLTNFVDAAATNFCRGLNGVFGYFPSACLTDGGQPALYLASIFVFVVSLVVLAGWKRRSRQPDR